MIISENSELDTKQMLRAILTLECLCMVFPNDPMSDIDHPLHNFVSKMYTIAHIGSQLCNGCKSGSENQRKTFEEAVKFLKEANICDVDKHIDGGYDKSKQQ